MSTAVLVLMFSFGFTSPKIEIAMPDMNACMRAHQDIMRGRPHGEGFVAFCREKKQVNT